MTLVRGRQIKKMLITGAVLLPLVVLTLAYLLTWQSQGLRLNGLLPEAQLETASAAHVRTTEWRGRPTVLVLFRSTCSACRTEIQNLTVVRARMPELRIELLSVDGKAGSEAGNFPVLLDPGRTFLKQARRIAVPTLYFVDREGVVRYARTGARSAAQELDTFGVLCSKFR